MEIIAYAVRRPWTRLGWAFVVASNALGAANILLLIAWHLGQSLLYNRVATGPGDDAPTNAMVRMVAFPDLVLIGMCVLGAIMGAVAWRECPGCFWAKIGLFANLAMLLAGLIIWAT